MVSNLTHTYSNTPHFLYLWTYDLAMRDKRSVFRGDKFRKSLTPYNIYTFKIMDVNPVPVYGKEILAEHELISQMRKDAFCRINRRQNHEFRRYTRRRN